MEISIDPADRNTGVVVMRGGRVVSHHTLPADGLRAWLTEQQLKLDVAIVERPATGAYSNPTTYYAYRMALLVLSDMYSDADVERISPGMWKPVARARKWVAPKELGRHERDAWLMYKYWYWVKGNAT